MGDNNFIINNPNYKYSISNEMKQESHCICCLESKAKLINLEKCEHYPPLFEYFFKYKPDNLTAVACLQCHNFLKKICQFKKQVEESLRVLHSQVLRPNQTKLHNLKTSHQHSILLPDNIDIEIKNEDEPIHDVLATDVKIERDSSDFENDIPLAQIKKKRVYKQRGKDTFDGKIRTVILSNEEMFYEREREALREGYLKLPFKCTDCVMGFDHEATLKDHLAKRHGQKKGGHKCDICKSVLGSITSYKEHTRRHVRRFECVECGKRNIDKHSVVKHYNEQHGRIATQFTCQICGFTTESNRSYRYHLDKHREKQKCDECGNTFVNKTALKVHMFTVHKHSSRIYSCDACNKVYNAKSGLLAHMESVHGGKAAYCQVCRTQFKTERNLKLHLRTHSRHISDTDKRFICDECGTKFLKKSTLMEHIDWVHLNKTKYGCNRCTKVFKNSTALRKHKNYVHEKKRPPRDKICDHCGRGFTTLAILRSHIRTHTGERPLKCGQCRATFAHSAALYTHNKLLHNAYSNQ